MFAEAFLLGYLSRFLADLGDLSGEGGCFFEPRKMERKRERPTRLAGLAVELGSGGTGGIGMLPKTSLDKGVAAPTVRALKGEGVVGVLSKWMKREV